jgi:hypothetical protein
MSKLQSDWPKEFLPSVEEFLREDYRRLNGDEAYSSNWFFPLQRKREAERMLRIAKELKPVTVLEIGADKGAGVYQWVKNLTTVQYMLAIEPRGCPYVRAMEQAFPRVRFCLVEGSSYTWTTLEFIRGWLAAARIPAGLSTNIDMGKTLPIDVLFIDGDKLSYIKDFDAYLPLMRPDGIVFCHDINWDTPMEDYNRIVNRGYRSETIIDVRESNEALAREAQGIPPSCPHEGWLRHWRGKSCGVGVIYLDGKGGAK